MIKHVKSLFIFVMIAGLVLLLYNYKRQLDQFNKPLVVRGTYIYDQNSQDLSGQRIVINHDNTVYMYRQFEAIDKGKLTQQSDTIYHVGFKSDDYLIIEKNGLYYVNNHSDTITYYEKESDVPTFINIHESDFD